VNIRYWSLFIPLVVQLPLLAQPCNLTSNYNDFITARRFINEGRAYVVTAITAPTPGRCYSGLVSTDARFLDFLVTNYRARTIMKDLGEMPDTVAMNSEFHQRLASDGLFMEVMSGWVARSLDQTIPKDTVSFDGLLNVAVKFFSLTRVTPDGGYSGFICVGKNDIKKTQVRPEPYVEAFCFSAIFEHAKEMQLAFRNAMMQVKKVDLGNDDAEKLLRAQGATFLLMHNSEQLRNVLRGEYERRKEFLPFVLVN
jgi:hypothetical protein